MKNPRAVSSDHYPNGRNTYAALPDDDKLRICSNFDPQFNRIAMMEFGATHPGSLPGTLNAIMVKGLRVRVTDMLTTTQRLVNEQTCKEMDPPARRV